jgi:DNA-binding CsgD family transcriptional regulator
MTRLYGRDDEVTAIQEWLRGVGGGRGGVAVIEGSAGIGKSRLITEAAALAAADGYLVASAQADQLGGVAPLTVLLDAFRDCDPPLVTSDDMTGLAELPDQRFWLLDRLRTALEKQAATRPVLVTVDDLQWAEPATLWAVGSLATQLTSVPVGWLLARRGAPVGNALAAFLAKLGGLEQVGIALGPLSPDAASALAGDLLGATPDSALLDLVRRAEGNPFLVVEAVRFASAETGEERSGRGGLGGHQEYGPAPLPAGFVPSARSRLSGIDPSSRQLLEVGAVFGRRFNLREVAAMLGLPVAGLMPATRDLLQGGVLHEDGDRFVFAHDLWWQAVYEDLPVAVRKALHRDAASALLAAGAPPLQIAGHLLEGADSGDAEAVGLLLRAARDAAPRSPGTASDLYARVLQLAPGPGPEHTRALVEAVPVLVRAGRLDQMRQIADRALEASADPATHADIRYAVSVGEALSGNYVEALVEARAGLSEIGAAPAGSSAAGSGSAGSSAAGSTAAGSLLRSVEALYLAMTGEVEPAIAAARAAVRAGDQAGQPIAVTMGLPAEAIAQRLAGRFAEGATLAEQAAQRADRESPATRLLQPRRWYAWLLTALDRFEEADAEYGRTRQEMDSLGLGVLLHVWHVHRAGLRLAAGRLDESVVEAEAAVAVAEELQTAALLPTALGLLARIAVARGDVAQAAEILARAPSRGRGVYELELDLARGLVADAAGESRKAVELMAPIWSVFTDHFGILALAPTASPSLVRVALRAGVGDLAVVAADAGARLAALNPQVASVVGAARHAAGLLHDDVDLLMRAVEDYRDSPRHLARAAACEDAGTALAVRSGQVDALPFLDRALRLYLTADATGDAARVRRFLRELGVHHHRMPPARPRTGWGSLSDSERRVARLVATGLTNRAVADQLFLSRHTVDSHLRHIFAKLDINTRVELTRVVVEHEPDADGPSDASAP